MLARILFIYAKLNPGVKYVQGMNEILATLYYCFYDSQNPAEYVSEPDLFSASTSLFLRLETASFAQWTLKILGSMVKCRSSTTCFTASTHSYIITWQNKD